MHGYENIIDHIEKCRFTRIIQSNVKDLTNITQKSIRLNKRL